MFVTNHTFERLVFLLIKATGAEILIEIGPSKEAIEESKDACEYQYDHELKRVDAIQSITRNNVCVISSRDIMQIGIMCAQNCATEVYHISQQTWEIKAKTKHLNKPYDLTLVAAQEDVKRLNRILMEQLNGLSFAEQVLKLDLSELKVLSALYDKKDSSLNAYEIAKNTNQVNRLKFMAREIAKLEDKGMVISDREKTHKHIYGKKINYIITTKGIEAIMKYIYYIFEKTQS